jgi:hypothetical protein
MNSEFLRVCAQDLQQLADAIKKGRTDSVGSFAIFKAPDDFDRWEKLIGRIHRAGPWKDHLTRFDVRTGLDAIVHDLAQHPELDLETRMEAWRQAMQTMDVRLELFPVQGFTVYDQPLALGRVKFWHLSGRRIEGLVRFTVKGNAPAEERRRRKQQLIKDLGGLKDTTVAIYQARGSAQRTRQDALTEVRRVLPVLRALTMLHHHNATAVDIAVAGDAKRSWHDGYALTPSGAEYGQHFEGGNLFPFMEDLTVNRMYLPDYQALGLGTVQTALTDAPPSDSWASTLALAYQWIGTAQQAVDPEAAILSLAVALEVLFSTSHQGLTQTIADGVAFLTRTGRDARLRRVDEVTKFYEVRSKITHGTPTTVTWEQVNRLRDVLREVLLAAVAESGPWIKKGDFHAHLKRLKYGDAP